MTVTHPYVLSALVATIVLVGITIWRLRRALRARAAAESALSSSHKQLEDLKWALDQSAIVATTR